MTKIRLLLIIELIFLVTSLMPHNTALLLTSLFPVFCYQPLLCLTILFVHSILLQNPKLKREEIYNRTPRDYCSGRLPNKNICFWRTLVLNLLYLKIRCTTVNYWVVTALRLVLNHSLITLDVFVTVLL